MPDGQTNALIHVVDRLRPSQIAAVHAALRNEAGVSAVRASAGTGQLMMVVYDPGVVSAQTLLSRAQRYGQASLIGL